MQSYMQTRESRQTHLLKKDNRKTTPSFSCKLSQTIIIITCISDKVLPYVSDDSPTHLRPFLPSANDPEPEPRHLPHESNLHLGEGLVFRSSAPSLVVAVVEVASVLRITGKVLEETRQVRLRRKKIWVKRTKDLLHFNSQGVEQLTQHSLSLVCTLLRTCYVISVWLMFFLLSNFDSEVCNSNCVFIFTRKARVINYIIATEEY